MTALNQLSGKEAAIVIQRAQGMLGRLQMQFSDDRVEFWALALAWEAVRLAWYVVSNDSTSASEKLVLVERALDDFRRVWRGKIMDGEGLDGKADR